MTNPRAMIGDIPVFCAYDEIIPTANAKPHPMNPNKHPDRQINMLAEIIRRQGWRAPITISNRSGYIVRGHGRLMAAQLLGTDSVPVDFQNYESEAAEKADMIADNRISEFSDLDDDTIAELLAEINDSDLDAELTGYDMGEIYKILEITEPPEIIVSNPTYETPRPTTISSTTSATYTEPTEQPSVNNYYSESFENDIQRKQDQTGEINLNDYAEDRYTHECPKCKFRW